MTKRIAITGAGGVIGRNICILIREIEPDSEIVGLDTTDKPWVSDYVDMCMLVPTGSSPNYIETLQTVLKKNDIQTIVVSTENELEALMSAGGHIPDICIVGYFAETFNDFADKYTCFLKLSSLGIPHANTWLLPRSKEELSRILEIHKKIVVKPRKGSGSKGMFVIQCIDDLPNSVYRQASSYIAQEYIGSITEEYTVALSTLSGYVEQVQFKRTLESGTTCYAEVVYREDIGQICSQLHANYTKPFALNIQLRVDASGSCQVIEINPRFSSTVLARHMLGFRDFRQWFRYNVYGKLETAGTAGTGLRIARLSSYKIIAPS